MNNEQLGFEFLPDLPTAPVGPKVLRKRAPGAPVTVASPAVAAPVPAAQLVPQSAPMDAEAMAQHLQAHPDYRILRRLVPRLQWSQPDTVQTRRVVVLDTETTGLDASREAIIELALLVVDVDVLTGLPVGTVQVYDELEDPGKSIPKDVVAITGITDADVRGKHLDDARIEALLQGAELVVAHNAGFDRPFVEARLPVFASLPWACSFADLDWKAQGHGSAKLESLAQAHGWFYDAHRAEMDCHALLAVLAQPLPHATAHTAALATPTGLSHLLQAAQTPSYRLSATNAPFDAKDLLKARGYRWNADLRVWQTRVSAPAALDAELQWLKAEVYHQRAAAVQLETLDALHRYSSRPGAVQHRQL